MEGKDKFKAQTLLEIVSEHTDMFGLRAVSSLNPINANIKRNMCTH